MGLIEKFKTGMEHAQEAARLGATMSTPDARQADYAQLANKLAQAGVPCTAVIESVEETGKSDLAGKEYAIDVTVEGSGSPYGATVRQFLAEGTVAMYTEGSRWQAKADPDDPGRLLLYSQAW